MNPLESTRDCWIRQDTTDSNDCTTNDVRVGRSGAGNKRRALLRFSLPSNLTSGMKVSNATLSLYAEATTTTSNVSLAAHRVYGAGHAWDSCVTWSHRKKSACSGTTEAWTTAGGNFDSIPADSTTAFNSVSNRNLNVTSPVQTWVDGATENNGFLIKTTDESVNQVVTLTSSEGATAANHPMLKIKYWQPEIGVQLHPWDLEALPTTSGGTWTESAARTDVLTKVRDADIGWIRIDVGWASWEHDFNGDEKAAYVQKIGTLISEARNKELKVLVTLWYTPDWAVSGSCLDGGDDGRSSDLCRNNAPDVASDFGDFAGVVANRFSANIDAYEIWNEPDLQEFWAPSWDQSTGLRQFQTGTIAHAKLLEDAYGKIKAQDPTAKVMNGGPSLNDRAWFNELYERQGTEGDGMKDDFDVLATHAYVHESDNAPECPAPSSAQNKYTVGGVADVAGEMAEHGDQSTPIWFTEFGWYDTPDQPLENQDETLSNTSVPVSESQQGDFAVRTIRLLSKYPQVENAIWYNTHDRVALRTSSLTTSFASDDIIRTPTSSPHGLSAGNKIVFTSITGGAGIALHTPYHVLSSGLTTTTFKVSATSNGSPINFTTNITAGKVEEYAPRKTFGLLNRDLSTKPAYTKLDSLLGGQATSTTAFDASECDF